MPLRERQVLTGKREAIILEILSLRRLPKDARSEWNPSKPF